MANKHISDHLLQAFAKRIVDQTWIQGKPLPAVRRLAAMFGVARATMDGAIREASRRGLLVTEARRSTRVAPGALRLAERQLKQLKGWRRSARIAVLVPDSSQPGASDYQNTIVASIIEEAVKHGWTAETVLWPVTTRADFPRLLIDRSFDGAFCIMARPERLMPLYYMRQRSFPIVIYNRKLFDLPLPAVMFDEYAGVQQLGQLFYALGHRRICLLTEMDDGDCFSSRRVTGWLDFCRQKDLLSQWGEPVHLLCHPEPKRALRAFFQRSPLPTGVIFGSGSLLSAFLKLDKFGLRVPEDISIAASHCLPDDFADGEYPPITRLMPNVRRMAECSIELLGRMMDGEPYPPPIRLPYTLVRSDSIGPPPTCK